MINEIEFQAYLQPTPVIDAGHPSIRELAQSLAAEALPPVQKAINLYHFVRDEILYDPYQVSQDPEKLKASYTLSAKRGFCVAKSILLAALCRAVALPSRLGFADVRNHLTTPRLKELMQTDLFVYHGYTEIFLNGRFVKATPAFNLALCRRFGIQPLPFDGEHDSVFHAYDVHGQHHMEYIHDHGAFADVPLDDMLQSYRKHYPHLFDQEIEPKMEGDFAEEARAL